MNRSPEGPAGKKQAKPSGDASRSQSGSQHEPEFNEAAWMPLEAISLDATHTLFEPREPGRLYMELLTEGGVALPVDRVEEEIRRVWFELAADRPRGTDRFRCFAGGALGFWTELIRRVLATFGVPPPPSERVAQLFERFAQPEAWRVYEDVQPSLEVLCRSGYRLGLVSNWDERLPSLLGALGLASRFEAIVVSSEVGVEKPAPGIFQILINRLGCSPDRVMHVGDSPEEDVAGARAAGLWAVRLDRRGEDPKAFHSLQALAETLVRARQEHGRRVWTWE